jgi:hypothetical protein
MSNELKVGIKCEQIKAIEEYEFDYVGEIFNITKVTDSIVLIENHMGKGGIEREKFNTYFKVIEEEQIQDNKETEIQLNQNYQIITGTLAGIEGIATLINKEKGKVVLTIEDGSELIIPINNIQIIKSQITKKTFTSVQYIDREYDIEVKIRGSRTTVKLLDEDIKGSVYCNNNDEYDESVGINRAFKKAMAKLLLKEVQK